MASKLCTPVWDTVFHARARASPAGDVTFFHIGLIKKIAVAKCAPKPDYPPVS